MTTLAERAMEKADKLFERWDWLAETYGTDVSGEIAENGGNDVAGGRVQVQQPARRRES